MGDATLQHSMTSVVLDQLGRVSDRILRLEASRDWPVAQALAELGKQAPLRVLVRKPFEKAGFGEVIVTDDAGEATEWRNQKPRDFSIVIVGGSTGQLDAGLKDVRHIDRRTVVDTWCSAVLKLFAHHSDLSKTEVTRLFGELFGQVASGGIPVRKFEDYISKVLNEGTVGAICGHLHLVNLMPDPQAIDQGQSTSRLSRNRLLIEALKTSDDAKIDRQLKRAVESDDVGRVSIARKVLAFREKADPAVLATLNLPEVESILAVGGGGGARRPLSLLDVLDRHFEYPDSVRATVKAIADDWDVTSKHEAVEAEFRNGSVVEKVRLELDPQTVTGNGADDGEVDLAYLWTGSQDHDAVLMTRSDSLEPQTVNVSNQSVFRASDLKKIGIAAQEVDAYLSARAELRPYEPWLERDGHWLLLLKADARASVKKLLDAWLALVAAATVLEDNVGFIQTVQVLETVQGPRDGVDPTWVTLGPLHPFRLDPLHRTAEQTVARIADKPSVAMLGGAFLWAFDRCFPAYPTFHLDDKTLTLASAKGAVTYKRNAPNYLPPARDGSGLERVIRAIEGYSPWLGKGLSMLVIDPPTGGAVVRALERARRQPDGRPVYVGHVATSDACDSLDGFDGELRYFPRVRQLAEVPELSPTNIIVRFVPENSGGGQQAATGWQATRGAHLALELIEVFQGPFNGAPAPTIKIDPRNGNRVVLGLQALYAKLKGGRPAFATIRPLLQTDEAPVLSRLADKTDWVIFAAPGPLGLISPRTINNTLRFVGRANMGVYGLYVYASNDLFPVRRHFESQFSKTPVSTVPIPKMVELLVDKAQASGSAVLFASTYGVVPQVASMVALDIAQDDLQEGDEAFVLSLDDLGWTRAWLHERQRADFLVVKVTAAGDVVLRIVESKSQEQGQQIACDASNPVYKEAIEQVDASLSSLREIILAPDPSLDEDLRFASLIEHLMAAVLARSEQLAGESRKRVFSVINKLSRREICPKFEGMAVLTQSGVNVPREQKKLKEDLCIVWAGAPEVARSFNVSSASVNSEISVETVDGTGIGPSSTNSPTVEGGSGSLSDRVQAAPASRTARLGDLSRVGREIDPKLAALAQEFITAAILHQIPVVGDAPTYIQVGPTLFSVGIKLREGSSMSPLRSRLVDIARDCGLGDRASSIEVDNDSEPRTVRVLLPRPDRQFPDLPGSPRPTVSDVGGYLPLYIGQTVDGKDWKKSVEHWPHMLVAGTTGSGKTVFVRALLTQLAQFGGGFLQTVVVDGKGDTDYLGLLPANMFPTAFPEVLLGHQSAIEVLRWAIDEMEVRRKRIVEIARETPSPDGVKATDLYKDAVLQKRVPDIMPLVLVIDEFADIMLAGKKAAQEFEDLVQRISQVGRSRLIHLVLATQRPDKETIRGPIKANMNARAVFRLPTQADSMTVLGQAGAERLLVHGDMLFQHGTGVPLRLQGYRA